MPEESFSLLDADRFLGDIRPSLPVIVFERDAYMNVVVRNTSKVKNKTRVEAIVFQFFIENDIFVVIILVIDGFRERWIRREERCFRSSIGIVMGYLEDCLRRRQCGRDSYLVDRRYFAFSILLHLFVGQHFDEDLLHSTQRQSMIRRVDFTVDLHR